MFKQSSTRCAHVSVKMERDITKRSRSQYLAGTCLATGLLVSMAALTLGAQPAAAACATPDSSGAVPNGTTFDYTSNTPATPCIDQTYNDTPGYTAIINLDSYPDITEGVIVDDINSGDASQGLNIEFNITGGVPQPVSNTAGTAISLISDGVAPYWVAGTGRPRGDVTFTTQDTGDVTGDTEALYMLGYNVAITNNGATINGMLNSGATDQAVIDIDALNDITIENSGTIESDNGAGADPSALAIWVHLDTDSLTIPGNPKAQTVYIDNTGTITGRIDLRGAHLTGLGTGLTDAITGDTYLTSIFVNDSNHTWTTNGVNNFTIGGDNLDNTGIGLIISQDETSFNFFDFDGTDSVNNEGEFRNEAAKPGATNTAFTDLEFFNNSGLINLQNDPLVGDQFALVSESGGRSGEYIASGNATFMIDSRLGGLSDGPTGIPSASTNVCGYSDCLTIGSSAGTTSVVVNDTAVQSKASYNPYGLLVVYGSSALNDFVLDSTSDYYAAGHVYETTTSAYRNVLDKGVFFYDLLYTPLSDEHRLYGVPDAEAFEMTKLTTAAQNISYATTPWLERQDDLRDVVNAGKDVTPGIWAKAIGDWGSRDSDENFSVAGYNYAYTINYQQNTYGAMAGIDAGGSGVFGDKDAVLVGLSGGYVDSKVTFNSQTDATFKGPVAGVYLTYLNEGFYIDLSGKADLLSMEYSAPSLNGFTAEPDVKTYGGQIEMGQRLGGSLFIEPLLTLAYATTTIDDYTVLGTNVDFQDAKSARGGLGLRLGGTAHVTDTTLLSGSLTGQAWDEVEGLNDVTFHTEGPDLTLQDDFSGVFGEVGGSLSLTGLESGLSGFVSGGAKFKSDYIESNVKIGARYVF